MKISHMNILQKADLIRKISNDIKIKDKHISKYNAYIYAVNEVKKMESEENELS